MTDTTTLSNSSSRQFDTAAPCWQHQELRDGLGIFDGAFIRTARKDHRCNGGHNGEKHTRCPLGGVIHKGEIYIEYLGETPLYQSGYRYHPECARQQGLVL